MSSMRDLPNEVLRKQLEEALHFLLGELLVAASAVATIQRGLPLKTDRFFDSMGDDFEKIGKCLNRLSEDFASAQSRYETLAMRALEERRK